eukprot:4234702-Pleurochrysis_carterae.AAC.2
MGGARSVLVRSHAELDASLMTAPDPCPFRSLSSGLQGTARDCDARRLLITLLLRPAGDKPSRP